MSTTEDLIDSGERERGSSKLLAVWGRRGPAGDGVTDWSQVLRADARALQAPRVVVSGAAFPGLGAVAGGVHV
ncbi:MAG: hypothetical protein AAGC46_06345 [Solirubrobacteraceae bacterium]|nr:hypothetical protein [Patulibacter sp.]